VRILRFGLSHARVGLLISRFPLVFVTMQYVCSCLTVKQFVSLFCQGNIHTGSVVANSA
jgi:hypothetical protein